MLARGAADDEAGTATTLPDRTASVAAIERALRARGRRRLVPWLGWGVAAAAAAVLLSVGWRSLRSTEPARRRAAVARGAARGRHEARGRRRRRLRAPRSRRRTAPGPRPAAIGSRPERPCACRAPAICCSRSIRARACASAPSSRVRLTALDATQRFDVESGTLEAEVAKVPLGGRFIVATGDAEVEVKGTRFEVAVVPTPSACAPFARTQVMVQEGVVVVRFAGGEVRLAGRIGLAGLSACPAPAVHGSRSRPRQPHASALAPDSAPSARAANRPVDAGGAERSLRRGARRPTARRSRRSHPLARSADRPLPDGPADRQRARRAAAADRTDAERERRRSERRLDRAGGRRRRRGGLQRVDSLRRRIGRCGRSGRCGWSGRCWYDSAGPSCPSGTCGWETDDCDGSICRQSCHSSTTCVGTCGNACTAECESASHCALTTGRNANVECSERADCTFVLGDHARADCARRFHLQRALRGVLPPGVRRRGDLRAPMPERHIHDRVRLGDVLLADCTCTDDFKQHRS